MRRVAFLDAHPACGFVCSGGKVIDAGGRELRAVTWARTSRGSSSGPAGAATSGGSTRSRARRPASRSGRRFRMAGPWPSARRRWRAGDRPADRPPAAAAGRPRPAPGARPALPARRPGLPALRARPPGPVHGRPRARGPARRRDPRPRLSPWLGGRGPRPRAAHAAVVRGHGDARAGRRRARGAAVAPDAGGVPRALPRLPAGRRALAAPVRRAPPAPARGRGAGLAGHVGRAAARRVRRPRHRVPLQDVRAARRRGAGPARDGALAPRAVRPPRTRPAHPPRRLAGEPFGVAERPRGPARPAARRLRRARRLRARRAEQRAAPRHAPAAGAYGRRDRRRAPASQLPPVPRRVRRARPGAVSALTATSAATRSTSTASPPKTPTSRRSRSRPAPPAARR
jgi:hypothetical protein